jgi:hypothetical protein
VENFFLIKVLAAVVFLIVVAISIFSVLLYDPLEGHVLQNPSLVLKEKRKRNPNLLKGVFRTRYEFLIETPKGLDWIRVDPTLFSKKREGDAVWVYIRDSGKKRSIKIRD